MINPILSNIYLNELDNYTEEYTDKFHKKVRGENKENKRIINKIGSLKREGRYRPKKWAKFNDGSLSSIGVIIKNRIKHKQQL